MRTLTITREKTFVACLGKMKIYIEDPSSAEIIINNVPCRKIGTLKNGETASFEISNEAMKIFVIADKLSTNFCSELYELPEGEEDISLSGKNKFNPATGNAFRFNANPSTEAVGNRKRGSKIGIFVLIAAIILSALASYTLTNILLDKNNSKSKNFSKGGMTITLTNEFEETNIENFTASYISDDVIILALKEEFVLAEGLDALSLNDYAETIIEFNAIDSSKIKKDDDLTYFEYVFKNTETNQTFKYYSYVFKTHDAFWLIQFATFEDTHQKYEVQIKEWAKSIEFAK